MSTHVRSSMYCVKNKNAICMSLIRQYVIRSGNINVLFVLHLSSANRHFSVTPYITICKSTETYCGLYLRGAMSAVTGIYLFRPLQNIVFFVLRSIFTLTNSAYPDKMPHDGISPV